jgi:hypothetical protein
VRPPPDYSRYRAHLPRSILVLPPLNETTDVTAPYDYLATFPPATRRVTTSSVVVIDAFLKEKRPSLPGEMHAVLPGKVREVVGADAVLYVTIEDWGQKYRISSDTVVKGRAHRRRGHRRRSDWHDLRAAVVVGRPTDPHAMLIAALITQVVSSANDPAHDLEARPTGPGVRPQSGPALRPRHFDPRAICAGDMFGASQACALCVIAKAPCRRRRC